ncbi:MAG: DUF3795 domain-containing protein [Eubacteriaceae bacterium]|nr:DUF3795 domain-containing protein [Eubacteriaceae bacterium]
MKETSIAYCGLVCAYCSMDKKGDCSCKCGCNCAKTLGEKGCHQYNCCISKGIKGCWECDSAPCEIDMLAADKIKIRAFVRCIKEDGIDKFIEYLEKNEKEGIVYHTSGIIGDYDLSSEEEVLNLLRGIKPAN